MKTNRLTMAVAVLLFSLVKVRPVYAVYRPIEYYIAPIGLLLVAIGSIVISIEFIVSYALLRQCLKKPFGLLISIFEINLISSCFSVVLFLFLVTLVQDMLLSFMIVQLLPFFVEYHMLKNRLKRWVDQGVTAERIDDRKILSVAVTINIVSYIFLAGALMYLTEMYRSGFQLNLF